MADQFGLFWNSINSDRTYDADSFAEWLRKFFTTGIFNGEMQVTPGTGMQVNVAPGYANLNGKVRFFDAAQTFTLDPANGTYPRIDTIVVRADSTNRIITTEYVKGAYSGASPVAPAPVRTGGIYEIVLAQIRVGAGITAIMAQDITDTRPNDSLCGWVTSTVESVPMDQITTQMQADFLAWYDHMKGQLSEDAAGNLQLQIDETNSEVSDLKSDVLDLTHRSDSMYYSFAWLDRSPTVHAYKKNDVFWWVKDGRASLVVAYEDIPENTTLVIGLNVSNYTLGEAINALNNGLSYKVTAFDCTSGETTTPNQWSFKNGGDIAIPDGYTLDDLVSMQGFKKTIGGWPRIVCSPHKYSNTSASISIAIYSTTSISINDIRIVCVWKKGII